jgi:hypothetical protein
MLTRTFKQYAHAFDSLPINVAVTLDNKEIFNSSVPLIGDVDYDRSTLSYTDQVLCTWSNDIDFIGTKLIKVEVTGEGTGFLVLESTHANYICIEQSLNPYVTIPGGPDIYNGFYSQKLDGFDAHDPYTEVKIDGVAQTTDHSPECTGQWFWMIPVGTTFTATLNVNKARYPNT